MDLDGQGFECDILPEANARDYPLCIPSSINAGSKIPVEDHVDWPLPSAKSLLFYRSWAIHLQSLAATSVAACSLPGEMVILISITSSWQGFRYWGFEAELECVFSLHAYSNSITLWDPSQFSCSAEGNLGSRGLCWYHLIEHHLSMLMALAVVCVHALMSFTTVKGCITLAA